MGAWIKYFADGQKEYGRDRDVDLGLASWSRGRLDNMIGVTLQIGNYSLSIKGLGEYWQADDLESVFPYRQVHVFRRYIEKKISPTDKIVNIFRTENSFDIDFSIHKVSKEKYLITPDMVGSWLILSYDMDKHEPRVFFRGERI